MILFSLIIIDRSTQTSILWCLRLSAPGYQQQNPMFKSVKVFMSLIYKHNYDAMQTDRRRDFLYIYIYIDGQAVDVTAPGVFLLSRLGEAYNHTHKHIFFFFRRSRPAAARAVWVSARLVGRQTGKPFCRGRTGRFYSRYSALVWRRELTARHGSALEKAK